MDRTGQILRVSKRLLLFTLTTLLGTIALFGIALYFDRFPVSWFCFECGIIGGFVSIQQRLKEISDEELDYLNRSWVAILVIPIFGGIFALVLYLLFLSGLVEGELFPDFSIPDFPGDSPPTIEHVRSFLTETYPASGRDLASLAFWSFLAGFSERFVPQIIQRVSDRQPQDR